MIPRAARPASLDRRLRLNRSRWMMVAALVVVALVAGWWWRSKGGAGQPKYRTAEVERGHLDATVSATGTIQPVVQVEVGSQVSGTIKEMDADYNSRVRRGQVLCQIDPSSFHARVLQSEAAVARAEAGVQDATLAFRRAEQLLPQQYVAQADVDVAKAAVDQRKADLKLAKAQLDQAQVDFANTTIRAPIDGVVISRSVDVGQTVAASLQAPKLFVIANNLSEMQVETKIDEADIGRIHTGLPVTFTVDAFPDRDFEGRVAQVRLEPIIDQNVVTYTTVIRTRNPELRLRPGMTANVSVTVASRDSVLKVPNMALRFRPPEKTGGRGGAMAADRAGMGGAGGTRGGAGAAATGAGMRAGMNAGASRVGEGGRAGEGASAWGARGGRPGARGGTGAEAAATTGLMPDLDRAMAESANEAVGMLKPGKVYVLRDGKPVAVVVMTGLTDGVTTEVRTDSLQAGDKVVTAVEQDSKTAGMQPPPGMGGPMMGGRPGGGRGR
jgi:HlyD family secretion protein